jgi:Tfp pilus assembly protein PilN
VSWQAPNLARQPFLNTQPLRRVAGALAVAAVALTAWNVHSYVRSGAGAAARRAEIEQLTAEAAAARARLATLEDDLARRDLGAENRRAEFLNARIAQRAFGWNSLLDRLAEAMPGDVRLRTLTPRPSGGGTDGAEASVELVIAAEARDDEAMLELVDQLYAHPAFAGPNLQRESRQRGGDIAFNLTVEYRPEARR